LDSRTYPFRGQIVLREGIPADYIAIIREGEFEIVKDNLKDID